MHDIFTRDSDDIGIRSGYQLLKALRVYIEAIMFACMDVMTERRSDAGRQRLIKFHGELAVSRSHLERLDTCADADGQ